jgi:hypothetical protein
MSDTWIATSDARRPEDGEVVLVGLDAWVVQGQSVYYSPAKFFASNDTWHVLDVDAIYVFRDFDRWYRVPLPASKEVTNA